jgi:hypothetical protein
MIGAESINQNKKSNLMKKCKTCIYCKNDGLSVYVIKCKEGFYELRGRDDPRKEKITYGECHAIPPVSLNANRTVIWPKVYLEIDFCGSYKSK